MIHACPKPKPVMLERTDRQHDWQALDEQGNREARARAKGRCEVTVGGVRCRRRDSETHHHLGGWRLRGRGPSALAENKSRCCVKCHREITGHVLEHLAGNRYRRNG